MTAGIAQRIDALHGETGQILHVRSLRGQPDLRAQRRSERHKVPWAALTDKLVRILPFYACGVKGKDYKQLW